MLGVNTMIAATLATEIGEIARFTGPRDLIALVEASWSYRHPLRERHLHLKRSQHRPQEIREIGWKAQARLCKRYRDISKTDKPQPRLENLNCS